VYTDSIKGDIMNSITVEAKPWAHPEDKPRTFIINLDHVEFIDLEAGQIATANNTYLCNPEKLQEIIDAAGRVIT